ncbi:MAG: hypothetical protein MUP36_04100, partial [Demequinaceae bacterium]|nr:hypothetical protein [Demequinaceae bacterium]
YHTEKRDILNLATRVDAAGGITAGWLFVQDGVVVGYVDGVPLSEDLPPGLRVWTNGGSTSLSANTAIAISCAPDTGRSRWDPFYLSSSTILPAGEYEAYPIIKVDTSPQFDAIHTLVTKEIAPVLVSDYAIGSPGSWDCQQAIESTGLVPIDCVEGLYDASTGVATVTVPPEFQSPDIHVTLVGAPIPYTRTGVVVERDWFETEPGGEPSPSPTYVPDLYACTPEQHEAFWADKDSLFEVMLLDGSAVIDPFLTGPRYTTSLEVLADPETDGAFSDVVDLGVTLSVVQEGKEFVIVGYALATINDGALVVLDRDSGPITTTLTLSETTWCGQPPPEGAKLEAQIHGPASFTPTGGDERPITLHMWITPYGPTVY